ncbi:peptidase S41 [Mucilaginibacter paludis DSM 18603]|uniref:Peptidase S41 n=2 Tax=Mucilaginibacter TaxID=423349 RepID=H1Y2Z1_9SPHI|nr:peptidase S41 [Mucilaginibacter paludis DSM 18603]
MEHIDPARHLPIGWTIYPQNTASAYDFKLDSTVKQQGKYSVSINSKTTGGGFGSMAFGIPQTFKGKEIELRGYLKMENVSGWAGFWLKIEGTQAFNNMQTQNLHGTADWTEYSIKLPYNDEEATNIAGGAVLSGQGKIWFDNVRLYINGKPIDQAQTKKLILKKADQDTAFSNGSGIASAKLSTQQILNLTLLGQVWGFVKYHHYAVARGDINMDAELFRVMPAVLNADNNIALSKAIEQWIDGIGVPKHCNTCEPYKGKNVKLQREYGLIFDHTLLSNSLIAKLTDILNNRSDQKFYIRFTPIGNPIFDHEKGYKAMAFPDAGYRLLCLFRYWNMIQYFYPDRHLTGDWNKVLPLFIPQFVNDSNAQQYTLTTLKLICGIHDTHANIWSYNKELEAYRGQYIAPFQAKFIEGKLVVTGYYRDTLAAKQTFKIGDVITAINGTTVSTLIENYLPLTAASNYETQLRDMPRNYLLRSNNQHFEFGIAEGNHEKLADINGLPYGNVDFGAIADPDRGKPAYRLINNQIGYLYPGRYHNTDLPAIKKLFEDTKGIIIDMRCYPSEFMPFTFVPYIKSGSAPFVKFTAANLLAPGLIETSDEQPVPTLNEYKGKVIVIVNAITQSQAEYTTMAFQSSPNVKVIGSITAGADGNVSDIVLPGGISTMISGLGVLYPDGTETQRIGVKIDEQVEPTIAGVKAGRDELLERAQAIILIDDVKQP